MTDRVRPRHLALLVVAPTALCAVLALGMSPAAAQVRPQGTPTTTEDPIGGGIGDRPGGGPDEPAEPTTTAPSTTEATPTEVPTTEPATEPVDDGQPVSTTAEPADGDDGGLGAAGVAAVALLAFAVGLVVAGVPLLAALSRRRAATPAAGPSPLAPSPSVAPPPPPPAAPSAPSAGLPAAGPQIGTAPSRAEAALRTQRSELVIALIALRDQLPSEALEQEAGRALAAAGVVEVRPDGELFDPSQHRAVESVTVADAGQHDRVVSTERPGYRDGAALIRLPEVVVGRVGDGA